MNKRYIDFVPTQKADKSASGRAKQAKPVATVRPAKRVVAPKRAVGVQRPTSVRRAVSGVRSSAAKPVAKVAVKSVARPAAKPVSKPAAAAPKETAAKVAFTGEKDVALGVIENVGPKFVKTDVPKRPLSDASHFTKTGVAAAKAKKLTGTRAAVTPAAAKRGKSVEAKPTQKKNVGTYTPPKTPFINQEKVQKRPLSKNVYRKKATTVPVKEEKKGPVTIISKPEKDSHVGLIVTIILTIILGAAAGTVAFLLLPK